MIDGIVPEPEGGAQNDHDAAARLLEAALARRSTSSRTCPATSCAAAAREVPRAWASSPESQAVRGFSTASTGFSTGAKRLIVEPNLGATLWTDSARLSVFHGIAVWITTSASMAGARRVPAQARPEQTPEPFGGAKRGERADLRRPAPRRAPAALRLPARARRRARVVGGAEGRAARARASARSPCTSRITRSTTRRFEGEIPKGQYGAGTVEIWDRGTYELVEEKPRRRAHRPARTASGCEGVWTLVPAHLDGKEQNWLLIRKRDDGAGRAARRADATGRCSRRSPSASRAGDGWLYEVKWDGYRAIAYVRGGECRLALAERQRPDGALRGGREGAREGGEDAERRARRRGVRARRAGPAELLGDAAGQPGALVYYVFDLLEARRRAARRPAAARAPGAARELLDGRSATVRLSEALRRRRGAARGRAGAGARGHHRQAAPTRRTARAAHARLAQGEDARPRRSS